MARNLEQIQTERLILRGINETDAADIVEWRSDPNVYKYFKSPHQITLEEHLNWYWNRYLANENRFDWICVEKKSGNHIGVFGLYRKIETVEINYLLAVEGQHKGYAIEAIRSLIGYAKKKWNCKQVVAEIHKNNLASIAVVKRLEFKEVSLNGSFIIYRKEV